MNIYPRTIFQVRGFFNTNFKIMEVKKCFSKPTEKAVKKRGISLSKH